MDGHYARLAAARLGEPVEAAAVFRRSATPMLGSGRVVAGLVGTMSRAATRWGASTVPRRFVLAVTARRVHVLPVVRGGVGDEVAAWARTSTRVLAEQTKRGMELLIHPPGEGPGLECLGPDDVHTHGVVAALGADTVPGSPG